MGEVKKSRLGKLPQSGFVHPKHICTFAKFQYQKPLKEITSIEELTELFHALPEKYVERLYIIEKIEELKKKANDEEKKRLSLEIASLALAMTPATEQPTRLMRYD